MPAARKRRYRSPLRSTVALPIDPDALVTTTEVMWFIGYRSLRGAASWCRKWGVHAQSRAPGIHGDNMYRAGDVAAAKKRHDAHGRGFRSDLLCGTCGQGRPHGVKLHRLNERGQLPPVWGCETCHPLPDPEPPEMAHESEYYGWDQ